MRRTVLNTRLHRLANEGWDKHGADTAACEDAIAKLDQQQDRIEAQAAEIAQLRAALRPLALLPLGDDPRRLNGLRNALLYQAAGAPDAQITGDDVFRARAALDREGE